VIGVIGGYQEGGSTSSVSYADVLGANVAGSMSWISFGPDWPGEGPATPATNSHRWC
jgi:hypothetical protein